MHCYLFMTFFAATLIDDYLLVSEVSVLPRLLPVSAVGPVGLCIQSDRHVYSALVPFSVYEALE